MHTDPKDRLILAKLYLAMRRQQQMIIQKKAE